MNVRDRSLAVLLWMTVIGLAIWAGGTLYQMLVIVPMWSASPPDSVRAFFTETDYNRTIFRFFGPPFMVARGVPIALALAAAWHRARHRRWLLVTATCYAFMVLFTLSYVYPINDILFAQAGGDLGADEVRSLARRWIAADRLRFVVGAAGLLAALQAFRLPIEDERT